MRIALLLALALLLCRPARAEEAPPQSATEAQAMSINAGTRKVEMNLVEISQEVRIAAPPERVYEAYTAEIGQWWSPSFIMGGPRTVDLVCEAQPGGRLLEVWEGGGGCIWALVTWVNPGKSLHFGLIPGLIWSAPGSIELRFEADGEGTLLKLTHTCLEPVEGEDAHSGYVQGWTELVGTRFKQYVETGSVEGGGVRKTP
jgi:uncharacterized protein YndB with AHSA1/START domain